MPNKRVQATGNSLRSCVAPAIELVRLHVDMLVAMGPEATLRAARGATDTLPIVMLARDYDPLALGYVAGLARPGGNITGMVQLPLELTAKRLELLKEALPTVARVAVLWDEAAADQLRAAEAVARSLGIQVQPLELRQPPYEFAGAFAAAAQGQAEALVVLRLITSLNCMGCSTGRSAGLAPCRMRAT